ncbi:MAG: bifunctional riboflavin kinase/FAD synthetase [Cytophagaceae bacterium]|jgi:riboflavin kinase/FMN adenylyltransferase|nr:bifunctional riboflavin kinase/FAD synthetase [Cytophagaceae bacterium]
MQIHYNLDSFPIGTASVVTIGAFDGVHKGHKIILSRLIELSQLMKVQSVLVTFWPHPKTVLQSTTPIQLLNSLDEKILLLKQFSIDHLVVLNFNQTLAQLSAQEFTQSILKDIFHTRHMILGYDHRFGNNREGSIEYLKNNFKQFEIEPIEIPKQEVDSVTISSTQIRKALLEGDIQLASEILGYPYRLSGKVIRGKALGKTIGYPTANIKLDEPSKLLPKQGVYAVYVYVKQRRLKGMMNIGLQPTVEGKVVRIEVHIFDFSDHLYDEEIQVECVQYLREEIKFPNIAALIHQIQHDEQIIRSYFLEH